jgi:uncharacterized Zn finger protein
MSATEPRFHVSTIDIRRQAPTREYKRGQAYFDKGYVVQMEQRGGLISAQVAGSRSLPYRVRVAFHEKGIAYGTCDCSYRRQGWCKHIVATMFAYMHRHDEAVDSFNLEHALQGLNDDVLKAIIIRLVEQNPAALKTIKEYLALLSLLPQDEGRVIEEFEVENPEIGDFYDALGSGWDVPIDTEPIKR